MARDFDTADTDSVELNYNTHSILRSYAGWVLWNGTAIDTGRFFEKRVSGAQVEGIYFAASVGEINYFRAWTGGTAQWRGDEPSPLSSDVWYHWVVTYDSGDTGNDAEIYRNGNALSITEFGSAPSGSLVNNADNYVIGNRKNDNDRHWEGYHAEFGIWNRIVSATEIAAMANGYSPLFFAKDLVSYTPMINPIIDRMIGDFPLVSGTGIVTHIPMIYPSPPFISHPPVVARSGVPIWSFRKTRQDVRLRM